MFVTMDDARTQIEAAVINREDASKAVRCWVFCHPLEATSAPVIDGAEIIVLDSDVFYKPGQVEIYIAGVSTEV